MSAVNQWADNVDKLTLPVKPGKFPQHDDHVKDAGPLIKGFLHETGLQLICSQKKDILEFKITNNAGAHKNPIVSEQFYAYAMAHHYISSEDLIKMYNLTQDQYKQVSFVAQEFSQQHWNPGYKYAS